MIRLGIWVSHPIQYYAPWFRHLTGVADVEVFYGHRVSPTDQAEAGFGVEFEWDIPLLEGYPYRWLENIAPRPNVETFSGCDTPEIRSILKHEIFDAFLVFGWGNKSAVQTIQACRHLGIPIVMRGDSQLGTPRSLAKRVVKYLPYRWFLRRIDAHVYVGKNNHSYLSHYGVPESRLFFAPHFVDNNFFVHASSQAQNQGIPQQLRSTLGIEPQDFVFLFAGKMIPKKRPRDLLEAFKLCQDLGHPNRTMHLVCIGDGPLRPSLEQLAKPLGGKVHFIGFRNQSEMPAWYRAADALVLPSDGGETWGLVVNEAMACGLPAIVSDAAGCSPDLIDQGRTGFTFPLGSVESLAQRMVDLTRLVETNQASIRTNLAAKVNQYSIETATKGLELALRAITESTIANKEVAPA